jgi:hypothetical protein
MYSSLFVDGDGCGCSDTPATDAPEEVSPTEESSAE